MLIGYARVSTQQQTTDPQEDELRRAGCEQVFTDTISGAKAERPGLESMLAQARKGDVIVVVRLDRLGRSLIQLVETVAQMEKARIGFRSLSERIDSTSAGGKLIFHIFASLAEFERGLIRERVRAGLDSARARGRVGGRPRKEDGTRQAMAATILNDPKKNVQDVCRALRVSRATAFRLAKAGRELAKQKTPAASPSAAVPKSKKATTTVNQRKTTHRPMKGRKPTTKPTGR